MKVAVYRILYGEDFIAESIRAISPFVDHVVIAWSDRPWRDVDPEKIMWDPGVPIDGWKVRIDKLSDPKVECVYHHVNAPDNQYTHIVNDVVIPMFGVPEMLVCLEPDHVWGHAIRQAIKEFEVTPQRCAISRQIEMWKGPRWRIPERPTRTGTVFWNLSGLNEMPVTGKQAEMRGTDICRLKAAVHNMGFAVSERSMRLKHDIAVAISGAIQDSQPDPRWLDDKWLPWSEDNQLTDLEIAMNRGHMIPHAIPYDPDLLPAVLQEWKERHA